MCRVCVLQLQVSQLLGLCYADQEHGGDARFLAGYAPSCFDYFAARFFAVVNGVDAASRKNRLLMDPIFWVPVDR